jgi:uncharacterized protein
MLFLQGTQDELAELKLMESVTHDLGARTTLTLFEAADHSFHAPKSRGRTDAQRLEELTHTLARWIKSNGVVN